MDGQEETETLNICSLFVCIEKTKESADKLLELINEFNMFAECKSKHTHKLTFFM